MFTGIIESLGKIIEVSDQGSNRHFRVASDLSDTLKIDQSIAHDGVCLTVVEIGSDWHGVTAVMETLDRSILGTWESGTVVNLERSMKADGRLDGHIVQGHVDSTAICERIESHDGSWHLFFHCEGAEEYLLVDKGSVCINGVSLTVVRPSGLRFSVAIIPYTWEHTNLCHLSEGQSVNIEFDILGKYIARHMPAYVHSRHIP